MKRLVFISLTIFSIFSAEGQVSDSCNLIPEQKAISIAQENGCYLTEGEWYTETKYNHALCQWEITSQLYGNYKGKRCEGKTCTWKIHYIYIDAQTAAVIEKGIRYAWGPPPKF